MISFIDATIRDNDQNLMIEQAKSLKDINMI